MFFHLLEKHNVPPNFWCSEEYVQMGDGTRFNQDGWHGIIMDDLLLTPPISEKGVMEAPPHDGFGFDIWSDFAQFIPPGRSVAEFLDYEIMYDPTNFLNMTGKSWGTYRKNARKWARTNANSFYRELTTEDAGAVLEVFAAWLECKDEDIEDDEVFSNYLFQGKNRKGLFNKEGKLVAVNIWDENYRYINFRYCFCTDEPWLSEYARLLFYTDPLILGKNKLVNDGGCLGKDSLLFFKKRLNPLSIRNVFTWKGKTNEG